MKSQQGAALRGCSGVPTLVHGPGEPGGLRLTDEAGAAGVGVAFSETRPLDVTGHLLRTRGRKASFHRFGDAPLQLNAPQRAKAPAAGRGLGVLSASCSRELPGTAGAFLKIRFWRLNKQLQPVGMVGKSQDVFQTLQHIPAVPSVQEPTNQEEQEEQEDLLWPLRTTSTVAGSTC